MILDEAHERTLNTDFLLGSVKRIQAVRRELARAIREAKLDKKQLETIERLCGGWEMQELKVIVMSATIEADSFSNFFDRCPILYVKGRTYPVTVWHLDDVPAPDDKVALAREQCLSIHLQRPPGGILVFMPGQEEIESLVASLKEDNKELAPGTDEIMALPLYRVLSQHQQNLVFSSTPNRKRKVIVSTNIAETGLTIPGIKYVVDAGLQKERELFGEGQGTREFQRIVGRSSGSYSLTILRLCRYHLASIRQVLPISRGTASGSSGSYFERRVLSPLSAIRLRIQADERDTRDSANRLGDRSAPAHCHAPKSSTIPFHFARTARCL